MEMADNSKLAAPFCDDCGKTTQKSGDHVNGFQCTTQKSGDHDSFVIDMDNFPNNNNTIKDANSRITLQRTLSRKGSLRIGSEKKLNGIAVPSDIVISSSSKGSTTPEKAVVMPMMVGADQSTQVHPQISSSNGIATSTAWESKFGFRRTALKRPAYLCAIDPKRVLLFFATLSSMGTLLLIYFTLLIGKIYVNDQALE